MENHQTLFDRFFGEIPLNRFFERNAFSPLLMFFSVLVLGFVLFNIAGVFAVFIIYFNEIMQLFQKNPATAMNGLNDLMASNSNKMILSNTVALWLGLGLPTIWLAARHSTHIKAFLRIRPVSWKIYLLATLGWLLLFPIVGFLGQIGESIPLPDWMKVLEKAREDLLKPSLFKTINPLLLYFGIAITPAICEELMFRGYLQRQLDRVAPALISVVVCGVLFGLYHLSLKQLLPLSCIGIYLCWLTYKSGSILPAIWVHFLNNGFATTLGLIFAHQKNVDLNKLGNVDLPLLQMLPLVALSAFLLWKWSIFFTQKIEEKSTIN